MMSQQKSSRLIEYKSILNVRLSNLMLMIVMLTACSSSLTTKPAPTGLSNSTSGKQDVGGYDLYYTCAGQGSPTVILEAGGPSDSTVWELVRVYMGASPRVCAYDRANLGNSDRVPKPRTFSDMTRDLHTLLHTLPLDGPYVLVGHSMGGMLVQLYTGQYPEDVVGLVLVDAGHPDMGTRLLAILPPETTGEDKTFKAWREYGTYLAFSEGQEPIAVEGVNAPVSNEQVRGVKSIGDIPLAVVSRSPENPSMVGGLPDLPEDINIRLMQQWQDTQTELEGLSPNSTRFVALRSGHGVQAEEPRLVVEAIRHVLAEYWAQSGQSVNPAPEPADASSHAPVITGITERNQWKQGILINYKDIAFTDPAGDAITVINTVISSSVRLAPTDDIIRTSSIEQQRGTILTTYFTCRREYEAVIEFRVFDAAGNMSNPVTVNNSCPAPRPYTTPIVLVGVVAFLALLGLGTWLLVRNFRKRHMLVA